MIQGIGEITEPTAWYIAQHLDAAVSNYNRDIVKAAQYLVSEGRGAWSYMTHYASGATAWSGDYESTLVYPAQWLTNPYWSATEQALSEYDLGYLAAHTFLGRVPALVDAGASIPDALAGAKQAEDRLLRWLTDPTTSEECERRDRFVGALTVSMSRSSSAS